jgi:hypothetical protein
MAQPWSSCRPAALLASSALFLGACGALAPTPAEPRLEVVVARTLPMSTSSAADCLDDNARRISYPRGYEPYVMARVPVGDTLMIEQWFNIGRHGKWLTRYELRPVGKEQTDVRVQMETELTLARDYARAAQELVAYCAGR